MYSLIIKSLIFGGIYVISVFLLLPKMAKAQKQEPKIAKVEKLYINPNYARGSVDSQIFKSVVFIPLETTEKSIFGKIKKMEVTGSYFIVSDLSTNSILLFKRDGKFYNKIDKNDAQGGVINENFTVDRKNNEIITSVQKDGRKHLTWFNFQGKIVKQIPLTEFYASIEYYNDQILYSPLPLLSNKVSTDSINYFIKYFGNNGVNKKLLPFKSSEFGFPAHFSISDIPKPFQLYYSGENENLLYVSNYTFNVYALNNEGIQLIYNIILPQDLSLSSDSLSHLQTVLEKEKYVRANKNRIYSFRDVYQVKDNLFFETVTGSHANPNRYLAYNLKKRVLISLEKISSNKMSYFLPMLSYYGSIIGCDGEAIYSSVSSLEMFEAKDATADKQRELPQYLESYFKKENRKSNPVIVVLQMK